MSAGEPFNPWRKTAGFYAPDIVGRQLNLTDGEKRLYERAVRWAGRTGGFWYSFATMAAELGKSPRQVKRDMLSLEKHGLICHVRRGNRQSNLYRFLWHPIFDSDGTSTSPHSDESEVTSTSPHSESDGTSVVKVMGHIGSSDGTSTSHELCNELRKGISSSSAQESSALETTDDEPPLSQETKSGKPEALDALVSVARDQLRAARAAGAGVPLDRIACPDREITVQILEAFSDYADFTRWLESTVRRGVARKAKDSWRWGLFLADARSQAEPLKVTREAEEQLQRESLIEEERRQAAEAEQRRAMDAPAPIVEAAALLRRAIPWPLKARFERTAVAVSPNELERQARAWQRCAACHDAGTIGSAIDKDLGFCGCPAGVEAQHRDGADWCAGEIERVHSGVRSLLLAASDALELFFVSLALEVAGIIDDGENLEIAVPDSYAIAITQREMRQILERVGWTRQVKIIKAGAGPAQAPAAPSNGNLRPITQADVDAVLAQRRAAS
jgi:hypothetical protein